MSGLKSRQRPLLGDSALAIVDIGHKNAERALAETWLHEPRLAEPLGVATAVKVGSADSIADFIPELQAVRYLCRIGLERHNVGRPALWHRDPIVFGKEKWLGQDPATNLKVTPIDWICLTILGNARAHLMQCSRAVSLPKSLPCKRTGESVCVSEYAASHDEIVRRVELEQEQLAFLQRLEIGAGWSPEIDLCEVGFLPQQFEPFMVCDRDNQLDRHLISLSSSAPARKSAAIDSVARRTGRDTSFPATVARCSLSIDSTRVTPVSAHPCIELLISW
jgi:hypothetical protein